MDIAKIILEYLKALAWPAVVLTAVIMFRLQVRALIASLQHLKLPGGAELDWATKQIREAEQAAEEVEASPKAIEAPVARDEVTDLSEQLNRYGFLLSTTGYEWSYYKQVADRDPNLALAGIRIEIDRMLQNMASVSNVPFDPIRTWSGKFAGLLRTREVISDSEYNLLRSIINVANMAIHGRDISRADAQRVIESAEVFKQSYLAFMSGALTRMNADGVQPPWPGAPGASFKSPTSRSAL